MRSEPGRLWRKQWKSGARTERPKTLRLAVAAAVAAAALFFLVSCAPAPRFGKREPTVAVGVEIGVDQLRFRLRRAAALFADDKRAGSLQPGTYTVAIGGERWASWSEPLPPGWLALLRGPVVAARTRVLTLRDEAGRLIASAERCFSVRGADVWISGAGETSSRGPYPGRFDVLLWAGSLSAVNRLPIETYLRGVVSAEMSSDAPLEALKAQAVASRSVALARKGAHRGAPFDLCATAHCQVYRGLRGDDSRCSRAVRETRGMVLWFRGRVAEAPYCANCGGHTESAAQLWGDSRRSYLRGVLDARGRRKLDLGEEAALRRWILSRPDVYCRDAPSEHFRWRRSLDPEQLADRLERRLGKRIGLIRGLRVERRGVSGRAIRVRVEGSRGSVTLRGELRIRRTLAEPPLPSSCFVVDTEKGRFVLRGAGFGHGVGLCQDGAMGMARRGASFRRILQHYYPGTRLVRLY